VPRSRRLCTPRAAHGHELEESRYRSVARFDETENLHTKEEWR
jgi:hypothetical protein